MATNDGLICAYVLDGNGGGRALDWAGVRAHRPADGLLWVHLDRTGEKAEQWVRDESGIDELIADALLAEGARPREMRIGEAMFVVLRGVNLNPGSDPEDMVGARMWIEKNRIVTLRYMRIMAINDMREALERGDGPSREGEFLATLAAQLIERMGPVIAQLDDEVDELEDQILTEESAVLRGRLARVRRTTIAMRRYLAPQRDVVGRLMAQQPEWLTDKDRSVLRETADRTTRFVEDLDAARERAAVTQEELASRLSDRMNRTLYLLTIVASVLLPPSLLTGLLGINVGGMPGVDSPWAFGLVVVAIILMAVFEIWLLRRLRWI